VKQISLAYETGVLRSQKLCNQRFFFFQLVDAGKTCLGSNVALLRAVLITARVGALGFVPKKDVVEIEMKLSDKLGF
jgi:hypothetical protein